jgi:hypothetical protein
MLQDVRDEKYVDTIQLIKYAQDYGIPFTERYMLTKTQDDLWDLQTAVFQEIRKKDPKFIPIEMIQRREAILRG